ncbi:MAG: hypothetical protein DYG98_07565 [Haliscomenobacteraceae bacterium CHB4]|nr:hypothetical protein [Haliscomenobacteraceae bacterium CHB4]
MQKLIPVLLFALLAFVSCNKSEDDQSKIINDTWYIAYYDVPEPGSVTPVDNTSDFAGYTFEFNDNDEWIIHSPVSGDISAYWAITDNGTTAKLKMDDAISAPLDALNGTWEVVEQTSASLDLQRLPDLATSPDGPKIKINFKKQ